MYIRRRISRMRSREVDLYLTSHPNSNYYDDITMLILKTNEEDDEDDDERRRRRSFSSFLDSILSSGTQHGKYFSQ